MLGHSDSPFRALPFDLAFEPASGLASTAPGPISDALPATVVAPDIRVPPAVVVIAVDTVALPTVAVTDAVAPRTASAAPAVLSSKTH